MPATAEQVAALTTYCEAPAGDTYVKQCADEAADAILRKVTKAVEVPPVSVVNRAILEYGKEQYDRRQSRNGVVGLDNLDYAPMRVSRDPMKAAWPYLQDYFGPAVA